MHFLCIKDQSMADVQRIFHTADRLRDNEAQVLKGKTFVLFFPESSIRTRLSFEKGIQDLGGVCVLFPPSTLDKREALIDVVKYIENWADGIIVRHPDYDKVCELAAAADIPVINAMTASNHPCEILSDLYSIRKLRGDFKGLTYTFVGEHGNISNSWCNAAEAFDFKLNHVSVIGNRIKADEANYTFSTCLETVLPMTDVVLTDPLSEAFRTKEYIDRYQITLERMKTCRPKALLNPCPPFYRGEEVSADVIDSEYFVGYEFKKNLIYVQQAIVLHCLGVDLI
ncbi:MAG: ornithine carbamoyltransferase [Clostridia bacterium]|nr:ornithine carbamoyltransferase [Clostridia bacterium]